MAQIDVCEWPPFSMAPQSKHTHEIKDMYGMLGSGRLLIYSKKKNTKTREPLDWSEELTFLLPHFLPAKLAPSSPQSLQLWVANDVSSRVTRETGWVGTAEKEI